ncbi:hypothetical protein L7F22_062440 [Adiantum nelumboides]|nr:hypothetical protein [Adiantum nelumboides]
MGPCERKTGEPQMPIINSVSSTTAHKPVVRLRSQQRQELEHLCRQCPRPTSALLQRLIKDHPSLASLDIHLLRAWLRSRRFKEKRDEKLSPLYSKNTELKVEHESLLLLNNQLRSQALVLIAENELLKEQLEIQSQLKRAASSHKSLPCEVAKDGYLSDVDGGDSGPSCEHVDGDQSDICGLETSLHEVKLLE